MDQNFAKIIGGVISSKPKGELSSANPSRTLQSEKEKTHITDAMRSSIVVIKARFQKEMLLDYFV